MHISNQSPNIAEPKPLRAEGELGMKTYQIKTTNPNSPKFKIQVDNILQAINEAMSLYHGLIEEEITEVKEVVNY